MNSSWTHNYSSIHKKKGVKRGTGLEAGFPSTRKEISLWHGSANLLHLSPFAENTGHVQGYRVMDYSLLLYSNCNRPVNPQNKSLDLSQQL